MTIFDVLTQPNICYEVVGCLATVLHGYIRLTVDIIDIKQLEQIQNGKK